MPQLVRRMVEFEGRLEERTVAIEGTDLPVWPADQSFTVVGTPVTRGAASIRSRASACPAAAVATCASIPSGSATP